MTIQDLYTQREKTDRIRGRYHEEVAALRANNDLSAEGLQRRLADAYVKVKAELDELATAEREDLNSRKDVLEQRFLGARRSLAGDAATHAISARDASDRAARLKSPTEAIELLRRAESNGDEILVRALVRESLDRAPQSGGIKRDENGNAWDDVGRAYLDSRPELMPVAEELAEIETLTERLSSPPSQSKCHTG